MISLIKWCFLLILFFLAIFCESASNKSSEPISFFSEKIFLELRGPGVAVDLKGRFINNAQRVGSADSYSVPLLEACAHLNLYLAEKGKGNNWSTAANSKKTDFVQKLKKYLTTYDKKIEASLNNFHCRHAIKSAGFEHLGEAVVVSLICKYPEIMKEHVDIVSQLNDFSFLTMEVAEVLYYCKRELYSPFSVPKLVESVEIPVLKKLIDIWEWDLLAEDAFTVLNIRRFDVEFMQIISREPRFWLIWKKSQTGPYLPFPMERLLEILKEKGVSAISTYLNLILAFIFECEMVIFNKMLHLEYVHAVQHNNDFIAEYGMTPEIINTMNMRKWDLWYEESKGSISDISDQMKMKRDLIRQLEVFASERGPADWIVNSLLALLKVPLLDFMRSSFLISRDRDELITVVDNFYTRNTAYHEDHFKFVRPYTLANADYWAFLWKQLEVLNIDLVYDVEISKNPLLIKEYLELLDELCESVREQTPSRNIYWPIQLCMALINDMKDSLEDSLKFLRKIYIMSNDAVVESSFFQQSQMQMSLHIDAFAEVVDFVEARGSLVEKFRLAPEMMTREEISELIKSVQWRASMALHKNKVAKLRWLDSFTTDDLLEFFPLDVDYHLDSCEALYTVDPDALVGYLEAVEGAINYPDLLVWWIHPRAWDNARVLDAMSEIVPFSVFVKHPREAMNLNVAQTIPDIMGRIDRAISRGTAQVQKLILKWLVHMEWFFFQVHTEVLLGTEENKMLVEVFTEMNKVEAKSRAQLATWLKNNKTELTDATELAELVEQSPLSRLRTFICYQMMLTERVKTIRNEKITTLFTGIDKQFTVFTAKKCLEIKRADLENAAQKATEKCRRLIDNYFGDVERTVWLNRLEIVNIPKMSISFLNPIPVTFIGRLFRKTSAPLNDLQILLNLLLKHGYSKGVLARVRSEFVQIDPEMAKMSESNDKVLEKMLEISRRIILAHEIEIFRALKNNKPNIL